MPALRSLGDSEHEVVAVYTQPDRRAGRGRRVAFSPVKTEALARHIAVEQPASLRDAQAQEVLRSYRADVMVVAAYGLILPAEVLNAPTFGCLNIHASLLPRWRGAAPIQRAIEAGDTQSGVTIMQMDEGLDTGDMLHSVACDIEPATTAAALHETLSVLGADALMKTLTQMIDGALKPIPQDESMATYAGKLDKQEASIDWQQSAVTLHRRVCAFNPWPVAQTRVGEDTVRVWESMVLAETGNEAPAGTVLGNRGALDVQTGEGVLRLLALQPSGKKPMKAADYLNSRQIEAGYQLG